MRLTLLRFSTGEHSTLGELGDDVRDPAVRFLCFTLEDAQHEPKVPGETRIPAGTYSIELQAAGRLHEEYLGRFPGIHRGMLHLKDVPGFEGIMLHCGNTDASTEGCLLVGDSATQNVTQRGRVDSSSAAYTRIYPALAEAAAAGELLIQIIDEG